MPTLNIEELKDVVSEYGHVVAQPREGLRYVIHNKHDFNQYNSDLCHLSDQRRDICLVISPYGEYLHCDDDWYNADIEPEPPYVDD